MKKTSILILFLAILAVPSSAEMKYTGVDLCFDGVTSFADFGTQYNADLADGLHLTASVVVDSSSMVQWIVQNYDTTNAGFFLRWRAPKGDKPRFEAVFLAQNGVELFLAAGGVTTGTVYDIEWFVDVDLEGNRLNGELYLDGVLVDSGSIFGATGGHVSPDTMLMSESPEHVPAAGRFGGCVGDFQLSSY